MERNENQEVFEISIKRIFSALWRRFWIILLAGAVLGTALASYAWLFITPTYCARARMYVNNNYVGSPGFSASQITAAQSLADTYMVIMESHNVLDDVIKQTGLQYSYGQVKSMITAATINETEVFEIRVTCTNYKHATLIANAVVDILPDKISGVVEGSSVRVVDRAVDNPYPVGPQYNRYFMVGFLIGAFIAAAFVVLLDIMDTSIDSVEYLQQTYTNIPLLAVIPVIEGEKNNYHKGYYESADKHKNKKSKGGAGK